MWPAEHADGCILASKRATPHRTCRQQSVDAAGLALPVAPHARHCLQVHAAWWRAETKGSRGKGLGGLAAAKKIVCGRPLARKTLWVLLPSRWQQQAPCTARAGNQTLVLTPGSSGCMDGDEDGQQGRGQRAGPAQGVSSHVRLGPRQAGGRAGRRGARRQPRQCRLTRSLPPVQQHQAVGPRQVEASPSSSGGEQEDLQHSAAQLGRLNPQQTSLGHCMAAACVRTSQAGS